MAAARKAPDDHTILEIGGPEPLSQLEAVQIFEKVWNKKVEIDHVPADALQAQHASSDPLQKTFGALMLAYSKGDIVAGSVALAGGNVRLHCAQSPSRPRSLPT
jgi:uncharacterized protein YbjT (DUF2867 family)